MLPELHVDAFTLGPVRVQPFGLLLLAGLVVAHTVLVRRARGLASPRTVEGFALALGAGALGAGLLGARVQQGALSSLLGAVGALATGAAYLALRRLPALPSWDAAAEAAAWGWLFARFGCALAHDHLGPPSTSPLAVAFASGPRLDLGLLEWLLTPLVLLAARAARRAARPGLVSGAVAVTYALIRFPLDSLRDGDPRHAGLTAAQWAMIPLLITGVGLLWLAPVQRRER